MAIKDLAFPTEEDLKRTCKRNKLIPQPNGCFMYLKCKPCELAIVAYSHSQTERRCPGCMNVIMIPKGGKAEVIDGIRFKKVGRKIE